MANRAIDLGVEYHVIPKFKTIKDFLDFSAMYGGVSKAGLLYDLRFVLFSAHALPHYGFSCVKQGGVQKIVPVEISAARGDEKWVVPVPPGDASRLSKAKKRPHQMPSNKKFLTPASVLKYAFNKGRTSLDVFEAFLMKEVLSNENIAAYGYTWKDGNLTVL